jgi:hypothetical protein
VTLLWIVGVTVAVALAVAIGKLFLAAVDDYTSGWEDGV